MEYKIVSSTDASELERMVNELFDEGWEPYGSLVVNGGSLVQPMIRFDEEEEDEDDE